MLTSITKLNFDSWKKHDVAVDYRGKDIIFHFLHYVENPLRSSAARNHNSEERRLKLRDFDVHWHLNQICSAQPPVTDHPDSALPDLLEKVQESFSNFPRQQKETFAVDLQEL